MKRKNSLILTQVIIDEFAKLAGLNKDEIHVLEARMLDLSRDEMTIYCNLEVSKIDRILKKVKIKYDMVQPYSDKLPPRDDTVRKKRRKNAKKVREKS